MKPKYPSWSPERRKAYMAAYCTPKRREARRIAFRERYANDPAFRAETNAHNKASYQRNKAKRIAKAKEWKKLNPERAKALRRARYRTAHEHYVAKGREYAHTRKITGKAQAARETKREEHRAWSRARSAAVTEAYAREQLSKYSTLSTKDWPPEIVEAKRLQIILKRKLKARTNE